MSAIDEDDDVSLEALLALARESWMAEVHTALPARVVSYDGTTQLADVRPLVRRAVPRVDGGTLLEELPIVRAVPVLWPGGGGFFVHLPLTAGDDVLLVIAEADPSRYQATGEASDPVDHRRHHLAHAYAIPVVRPRTRPILSTSESYLSLGLDDGTTIQVGNGVLRLGAAPVSKAARADNVGEHLAAISADLEVIAAAAMSTAANYGTAAKTVLDGSKPIACNIVEVE